MSSTVTGKTRPVGESSVPHGDDPGRKSLRARKEFHPAEVFIGMGIGQEDLGNPRIAIVHGDLPEGLLFLRRSFSDQEDFHSFPSDRTIPGEPPKEPEEDACGGPGLRPGGALCRKARGFSVLGFQRESSPRIRRILRWSGT